MVLVCVACRSQPYEALYPHQGGDAMPTTYVQRAMRAALLTVSIAAMTSATHAQVPASPTTNVDANDLPAVEVTTDDDTRAGHVKKPKKAPAAAQQSSTPRSSVQTPSTGGARGPDTSDVAVSPTGVTESVDKIASSVTVITSKEIEAQQRRTLPDVLRSVPGLNIVQTGGPGGQTSVFMRGTNSNHVKVLIDGIDVSDPSNPNRSYDFAHMLANDIDRVEVLRGPQSGLYGADALGGVIVIYTKKGEGPPKATGMVEGGSFGTFNQAASVRGSTGNFNYSFNVSHFSANDIPVTPPNPAPPGGRRFGNQYENWSYSTKLGVDVTNDFALNFVARYVDTSLDFTNDSFDFATFTSLPRDYQSRTETGQFWTRGEAVWQAFDDRVTSYFGINYADLQNDQFAGPGPAQTAFNDGERVKFDWRTVAEISKAYTVIVGAEHQEERLVTSSPLTAEEWNRGAFAELQSEPFNNFFLVSNVRYDDNENFGGHTTWRVAPAYVFDATDTKIKGSLGTAFKAPTLSQRFQDFPPSFFGNPNLRPEESFGYDVGFEQAVFDGRAQFGAVYFDNDITDLIVSNSTFTSVENVGKAKTNGVEAFASADLADNIRVRVDYTYTEATNEITNTRLLRRPRNKAAVSAGWTPFEPLLLTGSIIFIDETLDVDRSTFVQGITLPSFTIVNVAADYKLNETMNLFGRIDNLFDEDYENPDGFLGTGFAAYAGIRFTN